MNLKLCEDSGLDTFRQPFGLDFTVTLLRVTILKYDYQLYPTIQNTKMNWHAAARRKSFKAQLDHPKTHILLRTYMKEILRRNPKT